MVKSRALNMCFSKQKPTAGDEANGCQPQNAQQHSVVGRGEVQINQQHVAHGRRDCSAESRLRPILMTAIASLAGFLPLVVANGAGAQSQQSLGTVIFGGLVLATVLSLGVVPPFYVVIKGL